MNNVINEGDGLWNVCGPCRYSYKHAHASHTSEKKNIFVYFLTIQRRSNEATRKSYYGKFVATNCTRKLIQRENVGTRCAQRSVGWLVGYLLASILEWNLLVSCIRSLRCCSKFSWISSVAAVETDFNPATKIYGEVFPRKWDKKMENRDIEVSEDGSSLFGTHKCIYFQHLHCISDWTLRFFNFSPSTYRTFESFFYLSHTSTFDCDFNAKMANSR